MEPAFSEGDYVLVNRWSYVFSEPRRGDVAVLRNKRMFMLKRITKVRNNRYFAEGDRKHSSSVWAGKEQIIGKVMLRISKGT